MTDLRPSGPARSGELLDGRYRLDELIGEGGMGSVWRAWDEALERTVAVKIFWMSADEATSDVRRESEKRLLASFSHPSLVTLFDAQLSAVGRSYLVLEYIQGGTLADRIAQGPVSSSDAASIAADLGEALHVVHAAEIVHRDVKPANVLLRPPLTVQHTFRAVLADFGIAYLTDAARMTAPGTAIGTAAYISPEQVRGDVPTPASDVYSLGLVLLEALAGERAFPQRNAAEAVAARLTVQPEVPGDWGYGWRSLLSAMTALEPAERPSALEVAARGRALDTAGGALTTALAGAGGTNEPADGARTDATRLLPPSAAPRVGGASAEAEESGAPAPPADSGTAHDEAAPGAAQRRRLWVIIATVALVVVIAAGGIVLWNAAGGGAAAPPELPRLEEPLGTHLRDLMEEVSP